MALSAGLISPVYGNQGSSQEFKFHTPEKIQEWTCPTIKKQKKQPKAPDPDPMEMPDDDEFQNQGGLNDGSGMAATTPSAPANSFWQAVEPQQIFKVAVWGDSHMAAGFFSQEMVKLLQLQPAEDGVGWIPATMNRPGVRLAVKKTCLLGGWRHESAHSNRDAALYPGPALVNLVSSEKNASVFWDLRDANGNPKNRHIELLFHTGSEPMRIGISINGAIEQIFDFEAFAQGPSILSLSGDQPVSTLRLHLISGHLRLHGLRLDSPANMHLQFDTFAFPGATAKGWETVNTAYLRNWFKAPDYQLVVLAFGTNEGNQKPFDPAAYEQMLTTAVKNWKDIFPTASCLLIGPGDRGVLIPRSLKSKLRKNKSSQIAKPAENSIFLNYSQIHQQIIQIQARIANQNGCINWSMFSAMGAKASAYLWARQSPPLMAADLIHFTVPGYQKLAQIMSQDIGWSAKNLWLEH